MRYDYSMIQSQVRKLLYEQPDISKTKASKTLGIDRETLNRSIKGSEIEFRQNVGGAHVKYDCAALNEIQSKVRKMLLEKPDISKTNIRKQLGLSMEVLNRALRDSEINFLSSQKPNLTQFKQWLITQPDNITCQNIADHYSVQIYNVYNWLKSWNTTLALLTNKQRPTKEMFTHWIMTQPDNISYRKIAEHYNVSESIISHWFQIWDITLTSLGKGKAGNSGRNRPTKEDLVSWLAMQPNNITYQKIAEHYNVTKDVIVYWCNKWNLNPTSSDISKASNNNCNQPTKHEFVQWLTTQPHNISYQEIANHYQTQKYQINNWLRSWGITLTILGKGRYTSNTFIHANYRLDITKTHPSHINNTITQADFDYKHMVTLIKDGLDSQIYVCTQDNQEFIKTPVELIDEYIERNKEYV